MSTIYFETGRLAKWSSLLRCSREREGDENHTLATLLNLSDSDFPELQSDLGIRKICTEEQLLQIYAGVCWYKFLGRKLKGLEIPILVGELLGLPITKEPLFVSQFRFSASDRFTREVMKVARLKKMELLGQVNAVWRKPPELNLSSQEAPTLCILPCGEDIFCLIYASINWIVNSTGRRFEDSELMRMIRPRNNHFRHIRQIMSAFAILQRPTDPITAKVHIFARRRKDHWIEECIALFEKADMPGAREVDLTS